MYLTYPSLWSRKGFTVTDSPGFAPDSMVCFRTVQMGFTSLFMITDFRWGVKGIVQNLQTRLFAGQVKDGET